MNLDDLLFQYFGTSVLEEVSPAVREAGIERLQVDLGLETDPGRRFALWALLYMLGAAPDLEATFDDPAARDAARNLMDMLARNEDTQGE